MRVRTDNPEPCLGQTWTYVSRSNPSFEDETIRLFAKTIEGRFEYETLSGTRGQKKTRSGDVLKKSWTYDPEAKGAQYWRDKVK